MFVKSKDQVVVISGKDKGTKGKVVTASPKTRSEEHTSELQSR